MGIGRRGKWINWTFFYSRQTTLFIQTFCFEDQGFNPQTLTDFFLPGSLVFREDQMFLLRHEMKLKAAGNFTGLKY